MSESKIPQIYFKKISTLNRLWIEIKLFLYIFQHFLIVRKKGGEKKLSLNEIRVLLEWLWY